eukprot:TRINITY_DN4254_c0_g1_i1.p1 TRINITY_DN4254_c0_g1~~TRINITY_DN4254_c0_g1_i1.p1  ORF type:complete len:485 (-),score=123.32 TRINITY_DN4254_c0_g1_i1:94-1434(-)
MKMNLNPKESDPLAIIHAVLFVLSIRSGADKEQLKSLRPHIEQIQQRGIRPVIAVTMKDTVKNKEFLDKCYHAIVQFTGLQSRDVILISNYTSELLRNTQKDLVLWHLLKLLVDEASVNYPKFSESRSPRPMRQFGPPPGSGLCDQHQKRVRVPVSSLEEICPEWALLEKEAITKEETERPIPRRLSKASTTCAIPATTKAVEKLFLVNSVTKSKQGMMMSPNTVATLDSFRKECVTKLGMDSSGLGFVNPQTSNVIPLPKEPATRLKDVIVENEDGEFYILTEEEEEESFFRGTVTVLFDGADGGVRVVLRQVPISSTLAELRAVVAEQAHAKNFSFLDKAGGVVPDRKEKATYVKDLVDPVQGNIRASAAIEICTERREHQQTVLLAFDPKLEKLSALRPLVVTVAGTKFVFIVDGAPISPYQEHEVSVHAAILNGQVTIRLVE